MLLQSPLGRRRWGILIFLSLVAAKTNFIGSAPQKAGLLPVPKPDDVLASVDLGFNTLLWHQTFINVTSQFSLTGDIPDFRLITSVPVRF